MQPIQVDFTGVLLDVATSANGMVALFFLFFLLAKIYDLVSKRGLEGEVNFQLDKAYDSYISYLDEKKYSKQTLEIYDPLDEAHEYEDRLAEYRHRKKEGLDGVSASSFSFSDAPISGSHLSPYGDYGIPLERQKNKIDFLLYPDTTEDTKDDVYIDDNGMDVYLTWEEMEKLSPEPEEVISPVNNDDYIPLLDDNNDDGLGDIDLNSLNWDNEGLDIMGGSIIGSDLVSDNFEAKENLFSDSYNHSDDFYSNDNGSW